jgi:hypothetical protein
MGMFDSFYDAKGIEWQTKALGRSLDRFDIGDYVPGPPIDYQAEVIGGPLTERGQWKFATIRGGYLASAGDDRDESLPLMEYSSGWKLPQSTVEQGGGE